jgi:uncharacterized protein involved in copper resistance
LRRVSPGIAAVPVSPFDHSPFDHSPFDHSPFDHKPFDHSPFDHKPFVVRPFSIRPFDAASEEVLGPDGAAGSSGAAQPPTMPAEARPTASTGNQRSLANPLAWIM